MRYTEDPADIILPTEKTIRYIANREGLGELSDVEMDFVWDLLAKTGGAEVRAFDEVEAQAEAAIHAMEEAQAFVARNGGIGGRFEWDLMTQFEHQFHIHQHQRHEALVQVDLNRLPGYNKPTQAVRLLWLFRIMQRLWVLQIVELSLGPAFVEALLDACAQAEGLDEKQMEMLEVFVGGDEPRDDAILLAIELTISGLRVEEMLRIARTLDDMAELQDRAKLTPEPNGEEMVLRGIQGLDELGKVTSDAYILPPRLRLQRVFSGELSVRNPHTRRARKQLIFLVVDGSGSMLFDGAVGASRAAGIVMNRLRAVIDGDAELYLRFFDEELREQEFHANSPKSARELMRIISDPSQYMGAMTGFKQTLRMSSKRVEEVMQARGLRSPEIVFITDGMASVPDLSVLDGKTLHTFQVGVEENIELSNLARQSGGVGVYLGLQDWEEVK